MKRRKREKKKKRRRRRGEEIEIVPAGFSADPDRERLVNNTLVYQYRHRSVRIDLQKYCMSRISVLCMEYSVYSMEYGVE